ncbi:unnamed protein product [Caenorhabditis auriculariae]|uniref:Sulfide:quinone oxidoreductase, mitochondrial n=1 Tax=Caenorhabditis auriculariae TaxID=2777116 RepID=A0A8S1HLZ2_9PELO|nr:unnamed protein product [Caenorhabditis auriculariae]
MKLTIFCNARHFKLAVVGGGAAGCGISSKFARSLPKGAVAVIESQEKHYYQPGFTLVGGGLMKLEDTIRKEETLLHKNCTWIKDSAQKLLPEKNKVELRSGEEITYDFLVVATGIQPRFDLIKGCPEALETPGVCSNYSPRFAEKNFREAQQFQSGNAIFTFPNGPTKCAGAAQKACYLVEDIIRKRGIRNKARFQYYTSLGKIFGIDKYAIELQAVAEKKGVDVLIRHNLIEVDTRRKTAIFEKLDGNAKGTGEKVEVEYSLLHISPVCLPPEVVRSSSLADPQGFVDVDGFTLQSKKFANVFAAGDCANTPNAKTAAAVSSHLKTLHRNLQRVMDGEKPDVKYDGYASCPLVLGGGKGILAEFNSSGPLETTPLNQAKPARWAYLLKRYAMPFLYWRFLVRGWWNGPATLRKILHFGFK